MHLDLAASEQHVRLAPVDLGLHPRLVDLRHEHLARLAQLAPPHSDVLAHRALCHLRAVLVDQSPPDPPRRVTLLARRHPVGLKPLVDQRPKGPSAGAGRPSGRFLGAGNGDASA